MRNLDGDDDPQNKEIWTTEWNFKDTDDGEVDLDTEPSTSQAMLSTIANSFIHAALLQEWYLKNVKINFDNDFRNEFFTYATAQNFLGGSTINMMGKTDKQDQLEMGIIEDCDDWVTGFEENYYIPKATMFIYDLLSEITKLDLNYVKTTSTMYSLNVNLAPTVFLVPGEHILYIYFTNVKQTYQTYAIDPNDFGEIFGVGYEVELDFDDIEIYSLNTDQLYSTAGRSSLFKINEAYDGCHDPSGADPLENRFEITETVMDVNSCTCPTGFDPTGAVCVKVDPISSGYFIVKFDVFKKGEMIDIYTIFPNPASTSFTITQKQSEMDHILEMDIEIFTMQGNLVTKQKVENGQNIDISNLPVGVYSIVINTPGLKPEAEMLVKMK